MLAKPVGCVRMPALHIQRAALLHALFVEVMLSFGACIPSDCGYRAVMLQLLLICAPF